MRCACTVGSLFASCVLAAGVLAQQGPVSPGKVLMEQDPSIAFDPFTLLVRFIPGVPQQERDLTRALLGAQLMHQYHIVPDLELWLVDDAPTTLALLQANPLVEYAELDWTVRVPESTFHFQRDFPQGADAVPNDALFPDQWGMHNTGQTIRGTAGVPDADIDAPEAWDVLTGSTSFVVAVIDSGTQWDHPDLAANIWSNPLEVINGFDDDGNGYIDDVRGWDFFSNDNNPSDPNGHGTHTAGTVGAVGNNGIGVAGVAWAIRIMPLRFIGANGTGSTSDAILALQYAVDQGVKVSNNSWGGYSYSASLDLAIASARAAGHLFVAAAGNDGLNTDVFPHYPSSYAHDNVLSVAATDNRDNLPGWSNFGSISVDLGAPGEDIMSTYKNSNYAWSSGTSMATPHVAGVAAMVFIKNPSWSYLQVRDRVLSTVRPTPALSGTTATGGALNLADALGSSSGQTPPAAPSDLAVADIGNGQVLVSWTDNSDNESKFVLLRQERVSGSWTNKTVVAKPPKDSTSYVDSPGTGTFRYRIRAVNKYGKSPWTKWAKLKVK